MKVAFTICSNNYLARAKVVADTFLKHHPDFDFTIFLVDHLSTLVDYSAFTNVSLVEIASICPFTDELSLRYNIIELNTAVKPAAFLNLIEKGYSTLIYLDPDLKIYSRFIEVEDALLTNNIIVTPHFCSPIDDGKYPSEIDFTLFGLYNLGFLAVKNSAETVSFLEWWHNRLMKYGYIKPEKGMFTDQLWVNYGPLFFDGFFILKHRGYNVANWNLYERDLTAEDKIITVNKKDELRFIHYSHYVFTDPYRISKSSNRHSIEEFPFLKVLITDYQKMLVENHQAEYGSITPVYKQIYENQKNKEAQERIANLPKLSLPRLIVNKMKSLINTYKK